MERLRHDRNSLYLFLGVTGYIALAAYVNILPPDTLFRIAVFFIIIGISTGFLSAYVFRRRRHAILITIGVTFFLLLRYLELRQPLYVILLTASLLAIEFLWKDSYK